MSTEFLRRLPLFSGLPEEDLARLVRMSEEVTIPCGARFIAEGDPGDALYVLIDGRLQVSKRSGPQEVVLAERGPGEVVGEMSLLEDAPRFASVRTLQDSRLIKIKREDFEAMLASSPSATVAILRTISSRMRSAEGMLYQSEKMAALGTLAAGLAHELNNPAAAARGSARQLRDALVEWERWAAARDALELDATQRAALQRMRQALIERSAAPVALDPLTRSEREGELQDWLEARGVEQAWDYSPALLACGLDAPTLAELAAPFTDSQQPVVLRWLGVACVVHTLPDEIAMSAERISQIVKAVKSYSYLDQAPLQEVDVHEGLENTLVILRHKLRQGVQIRREYGAHVPRITAYASELNQVWTNLIDNAVDAMQGQGELTLRTGVEGDSVFVEICDTGPGIPPEIQSRIYDAFFTTKAPGVGTGLGLNISHNIVCDRHQGQIHLSSRPGATCFQVKLPIQISEVNR